MKSMAKLWLIAGVLLLAQVCFLSYRVMAFEHHGFKVNLEDILEKGNEYCLECHCDIVAPEPPSCMPVCIIGKSHTTSSLFLSLDKKFELRSIKDAEDHGIKLVDGKIGCISCHNLTNTKSDNLLRYENRTDLCNACHLNL